MFNKIATFRALEARRIAPGPIGAMHSNDNLPGIWQTAGVRVQSWRWPVIGT